MRAVNAVSVVVYCTFCTSTHSEPLPPPSSRFITLHHPSHPNTTTTSHLTPPHIPYSESLLRGLICFDPAARWTVGRAMKSELFRPFSTEAVTAEAALGRKLEYMHYF